jgi:hypothetical protein
VFGWRISLAAGCLAALLIAGPSVEADEFDPLVVYEEARVLNNQWQICVKGRLQTREIAERLAEQALDRCRASQGRLSHFLIKRVGVKSAGNVMELLHEKYHPA